MPFPRIYAILPALSAGGAWIAGAGAPAGALGSVGNYYLDTTTGQVYEKTGAVTWEERGRLTNNWLVGTGAPAGALGLEGDWYFDDATSDTYEKTGPAAWTLRGNIGGGTGITFSTNDPEPSDGSADELWATRSSLVLREKQAVRGAQLINGSLFSKVAADDGNSLAFPELVSWNSGLYATTASELWRIANPVQTTAPVQVLVNADANQKVCHIFSDGTLLWVLTKNGTSTFYEIWTYDGATWTLVHSFGAVEVVKGINKVGAIKYVIAAIGGNLNIYEIVGGVFNAVAVATFASATDVPYVLFEDTGTNTLLIGGDTNAGRPFIYRFTPGGAIVDESPAAFATYDGGCRLIFSFNGYIYLSHFDINLLKARLWAYDGGAWTDQSSGVSWGNIVPTGAVEIGSNAIVVAYQPTTNTGATKLTTIVAPAVGSAALPLVTPDAGFDGDWTWYKAVLHSGVGYALARSGTSDFYLVAFDNPSWQPVGGLKESCDISGFQAWASDTNNYWETAYVNANPVFTIAASGWGLVQGKRVYWDGNSVATNYRPPSNGEYLCGIDANGAQYFTNVVSLLDSNKLTEYNNLLNAFRNNIMLYEMWYVDREFIVVKENHSVDYPVATSVQQHYRFGNVYLGSGAAISVLSGANRTIQLTGDDVMDDHGLLTRIPGNPGVAMTLNHAFKNAGLTGSLFRSYASGLTGVTVVPTAGAVYENAAGTRFTVLGAGTFGGGAGTVYWWKSTTAATGSVLPTGTMTKISGTGDATVTSTGATLQTQVPRIYINTGVPVWLSTAANKFGIFAIYGTKDSLKVTTPSYWAVASTTTYANFNAAANSIGTGAVPSLSQFSIPDELVGLEIAILGFVIVDGSTDQIPATSGNGFVNGVRSFKATTSSVFSGGTVSVVSATNVTMDTSQFPTGSRLLDLPDNTAQRVANDFARLQIQTVANVEALTAGTAYDNDCLYCEDTATWYRYDSISAMARDGFFVLNGPGGSGKWEAFAGRYRIKSSGDIIENNKAVAFSMSSLNIGAFSGRSWRIYGVVYIDATADLCESFEIIVTKITGSYLISVTSSGDDSLVEFSITTGGQIQYTSGNYAGYASGVFYYRIQALNVV